MIATAIGVALFFLVVQAGQKKLEINGLMGILMFLFISYGLGSLVLLVFKR